MDMKSFASLGSSAFAIVARKRQAYVAAQRRVVEVMDADPCDRACCCERRPVYDEAIRAEAAAYNEQRIAEDAWAKFCAIRYA